jgi:ubiquinone biosynthesis protein UbiJ
MLATLENALNRGLPRSPRARQLCAELAGRTVAIEISPIGRVLLESTGASLKVTRGDGGAEAEIIGGPVSLLALAGSAAEAVLRRGDVRIRGDAELAQKFRELMVLLRPEPEEELALLVGDVPAHQIGRFARMAAAWTRKAAATALRNVAEYLAHERQDLAPRTEAESFLRGVDLVREDVDRLAARLELLRSHSKPSEPRGA